MSDFAAAREDLIDRLKRMDLDSDGVLTPHEFCACLKAWGVSINDPNVQEVMQIPWRLADDHGNVEIKK